jgi:hypothetical protein
MEKFIDWVKHLYESVAALNEMFRDKVKKGKFFKPAAKYDEIIRSTISEDNATKERFKFIFETVPIPLNETYDMKILTWHLASRQEMGGDDASASSQEVVVASVEETDNGPRALQDSRPLGGIVALGSSAASPLPESADEASLVSGVDFQDEWTKLADETKKIDRTGVIGRWCRAAADGNLVNAGCIVSTLSALNEGGSGEIHESIRVLIRRTNDLLVAHKSNVRLQEVAEM